MTTAAAAGPLDDGTVRSPLGMVCTSSPLAARAAVDVLRAGGGAADAAVAAAAVLTVVNPHSTGLGGDAFALWWGPGEPRPLALAGAGPAPAGLTADALRGAGHETMPQTGPWTVTVPGAVSLWDRLLERCGRLDPARVLGPAVDLARAGFAVAPSVARFWAQDAARLSAAAGELYLPGGRAPAAGDRFVNAPLGDTLAAIAEGGAAAFYSGAIGDRLAAAVEREGGPLRADDLAAFGGAEWVEPLARRFRDVDVYELPPPGQGLVVLEALALYDALVPPELASATPARSDPTPAPPRAGRAPSDAAAATHALIECTKIAVADGFAHIADPAATRVPVDELLSAAYLDRRRGEIDEQRAAAAPGGAASDTVYVAVADADGGACSLIQSLYEGFGSGYMAAGTGVVLQNRGANFTLAPGHPNAPAPGKRPFHTIIPAMLGAGDRFHGCLGVVGGFMQPQGQVQILRNLVDLGMDPQAALDAPRWRAQGGTALDVEEGLDEAVVAELRRRGHGVGRLTATGAGGAQLIVREPEGFAGASDRRKDRAAVAR